MLSKCKYNVIDIVSIVLLLVGGLNWGLIGFFKWDLVSSIFGDMSTLTRVIFALVGLSAVWRVVCWINCCSCKK